jgi:hypothetical protein
MPRDKIICIKRIKTYLFEEIKIILKNYLCDNFLIKFLKNRNGISLLL